MTECIVSRDFCGRGLAFGGAVGFGVVCDFLVEFVGGIVVVLGFFTHWVLREFGFWRDAVC